MKQSDIRRAYEYINPDQEAKKRMLNTILSTASEITPNGKEQKMKRKYFKKAWLIAAILSLMVFLMGCAVVLFTVQDMKIGEHTHVVPRYTDEQGNKIANYEIPKDVISLQGLKGSPSQMAAQEWYEFESTYDPDHRLLDEADRNPIEVSREYDAYFVYTQEMVDKVDAIAKKYGLKLAGEILGVQREDEEIFYNALGISDFVSENAPVELKFAGGYFYACGNFKAEFELVMPNWDESNGNNPLGSIRYCDKEYLDTVFSYIDDIENCEQWIHKLSDGREVLIVLGDGVSRIFCDNEKAFISVFFDSSNMSRQDIELIADSIDFAIVSGKPDMTEAKKQIEEAYKLWKAEQEENSGKSEDPFAPQNSYAEKIKKMIRNGADPNQNYYALYDINGDGIDDLFLGSSEYSFGPVYTMYQNETYMLLSFGMDNSSYLCENGVIMHNDKEGNPNGYYFYQIGEVTGDGMEAIMIDAVSYDDWDECWKRKQDGYYGEEVEITEAEAMEIIESYGRVELDMKPVSEFSMY